MTDFEPHSQNFGESQSGVLKHWMDTQKADFDVAQSTQRDLRISYTTLIQQLIERSNVREAEQKAQMAVVDAENRRYKVLLDGVSTLEFNYLETRSLLIQMQENEDRILKELKKTQREALEARARYEALVKHSEHKLSEANIEVQRLGDSYANENATLKAKLARFESTTLALQQTCTAKDKEIAQLRANYDQLMARLSQGEN